jgi:hypothetical protein
MNYAGTDISIDEAWAATRLVGTGGLGRDVVLQQASHPVIRIVITAAAYEVIVATSSIGTVAVEKRNAAGNFIIHVEETWLNKLTALRWPSETYSDVILRLAALERPKQSPALPR